MPCEWGHDMWYRSWRAKCKKHCSNQVRIGGFQIIVVRLTEPHYWVTCWGGFHLVLQLERQVVYQHANLFQPSYANYGCLFWFIGSIHAWYNSPYEIVSISCLSYTKSILIEWSNIPFGRLKGTWKQQIT